MSASVLDVTLLSLCTGYTVYNAIRKTLPIALPLLMIDLGKLTHSCYVCGCVVWGSEWMCECICLLVCLPISVFMCDCVYV